MSQKIYLHIKEPCHENWEAMSPVEQGRFCKSCAKQVVDFSRMSDQQILGILSKAAGKTCGRFSGSQLERPVVQEIPYSLKPYKIALSSLVPVFIMSVHASGQNNTTKGEVTAQTKVASKNILIGEAVMVPQDELVVMGKISVRPPDKQQQSKEIKPAKEIVAGNKLVNKKDEPLPSATVAVKSGLKNIAIGTLEKSALRPTQVNTAVIATPIEYQKEIVKSDQDKDYLINLLEPVTVTGFSSKQFVCMAGAISIVKTVSRVDTVKTFVQKLFHNDMFKVFPNPVQKGRNVQLSFRTGGEYLIQLFDNSGKLYIEKEIQLTGKEMISQVALPVTISSGVYYLKAVNTAVKKSFVEKIIVL